MAFPCNFPILLLFFISNLFQCSSSSLLDCEGCNGYNCMENVAHCGPNGYLIGYGERNCKNFHKPEIYQKFDENGQKFINCTGDCLIDFMGRYVQDHKNGSAPMDCSALMLAGFQSHPKCYLECGFCQICKTNKWALLKAYNPADFFSVDAVKQVYAVIKECGIFSCFLS